MQHVSECIIWRQTFHIAIFCFLHIIFFKIIYLLNPLIVPCSRPYHVVNGVCRTRITSILTALNISTGALALRTFQTAGPVRASTLHLSLALQDHRVKCRASRLKITVARSMTNFATFSCILFLKFHYVCIA